MKNKYHKQINILLIFAYTCIIFFPNFIFELNISSFLIVIVAYFFLYLFFSIKLFFVFTIPIYFLSIIQLLFYYTINKSIISPTLIQISLYQSSFDERLSIIMGNGLLITVSFIFLAVFLLKSEKIKFKKISKLKSGLILILLICIAFYSITNSEKYQRKYNDSSFSLKYSTLLIVKQTYPLNLLRNIRTAYLIHKKTKLYHQQTTDFSFGFPKIQSNDKDVIVMIIGESARAMSFGKNNTSTSTTPYLDERKNVISFKNVFTPYSSTSSSLPFSLSRVEAKNWKNDMYNEKSIISAMRELGYTTFFIDNQELNNGLIDFYKLESDHYIKSNKLRSYDEVLLPILDSVLTNNTSNKKFIVLHSYGSHYNYTSRYPRSMAYYKPDHFKSYKIENKKAIQNAYNNSIRYTDYFLDQVISHLEGMNSGLLYFSDHGENVYDNEDGLIFHGYSKPNMYTLNIPLIVWLSDSKKLKSPEILKNVNFNINKRISTKSIFSSVLNLTLLDTAYYQQKKSVFNKKLKTEKYRYYFDELNNIIPIE